MRAKKIKLDTSRARGGFSIAGKENSSEDGGETRTGCLPVQPFKETFTKYRGRGFHKCISGIVTWKEKLKKRGQFWAVYESKSNIRGFSAPEGNFPGRRKPLRKTGGKSNFRPARCLRNPFQGTTREFYVEGHLY